MSNWLVLILTGVGPAHMTR